MKNEKLIQKLKKEQKDLNEKLYKLDLFITNPDNSQTISDLQFNLLTVQYNAMLAYAKVLEMRISDLKEHQG